MGAVLKKKSCHVCHEKYVPYSSLSKTCSGTCALAHHKRQEAKKAKQERKEFNRETKRRKAALPPSKNRLKADVQKEFNAFVRFRDFDKPCISCGRYENEIQHSDRGGKWDCGHYLSVGSTPELRFNEFNAHKQCKSCNRNKSGNAGKYRVGLVKKIGADLVDWLEGPHELNKYTIDELQWLLAFYKDRAKEFKAIADDHMGST